MRNRISVRPGMGSGRPASYRSRFSSQGGGGRRGGFQQKSFDPSNMVRKATVVTEEVFIAEHAFVDFALCEPLQQNIIARGYTTPTPIQDQAIPHLLEGRDLVGLANTGTGKTAAFLLPLINKVFLDPERKQKVLIVAPTRELAVQIEQEFRLFAQGMGLYSALCIGGVNIRPQIQKLRRNPEFVVGTPGRLRDLDNQRAIYFEDYTNIVFDEVDQMFDMGFIKDVKFIISMLPQERQSLFFSATMNDKIQMIMAPTLRDPVKVSVKSRETAANVDQEVIRTNGQSKMDLLHDLLLKDDFHKVLVFLQTKHATEKVARALEDRGFSVDAIHGNKSQGQRQRAIEKFKRDNIQVLVATDVASRGLDIDNVTHVINFDLPQSYDDYIHRIGRTGRASKKGTALTFVD